ncbi:MAG: nucleotidyltransferase family protein [Litoreibacter sp.]
MSQTNLPVMIFAAGFGTRMGALTATLPKPLIKVAGRPLIDYALDIAAPRNVVVNTHYKADQLAAHLAPRANVHISHEPDILETGGGLRRARPLLANSTVLTLNSDAIWAGPNPLDLLAMSWDPAHMDALMLMIPLPHMVGPTRNGDFRLNDDGTLTRDPGGQVYTGAQIVKIDELENFKEPAFSLNKLWNKLEKRGTLFGQTYAGKIADVGTPEGIGLAENLLDTSHHA